MSAVLRTLLVVGFVARFWWLILLVLAGIAAVFGLWLAVTRLDVRLERRRQERRAITARADQQHAWTLAGDDRGTYGEYRPEIYPSG